MNLSTLGALQIVVQVIILISICSFQIHKFSALLLMKNRLEIKKPPLVWGGFYYPESVMPSQPANPDGFLSGRGILLTVVAVLPAIDECRRAC
jgi:hypothetical protein